MCKAKKDQSLKALISTKANKSMNLISAKNLGHLLYVGGEAKSSHWPRVSWFYHGWKNTLLANYA